MWIKILKKLLVILIVLIPVTSDIGCKKQVKCGCDGDPIYTLEQEKVNVSFNADNQTIYPFQTQSNPYETFNFCNPGEWYSKISQYTSGDEMLITGKIFWNCQYVINSSNYQSQYTMYYKVYDILVTKVEIVQYGK